MRHRYDFVRRPTISYLRLFHFNSGCALLVLLILVQSTKAWSIQNAKSTRRDVLVATTAAVGSLSLPPLQEAHGASDIENNSNEGGLPVIKTSSGLKYIDLKAGSGPSPQYGQLVNVQYKAYIKLPANSKNYPTSPQLFDSSNSYLFKHGNGRMIAGLDEGIHTMKLGASRRLLIPPKLGYVEVGLGPQPDVPWNRAKLESLLDKMVEVVGGTVIFEVTLNKIIIDEVDQGYYQDDSISEREFEEIRQRLQRGNQARIEEKNEENEIKGQDRVR